MALEWSLKLKDGMSGPTQKASDALSVLEKRLKSVRGTSDLFSKQFEGKAPKFSKWSESIGKLFGPKAAKGFQSITDALGKNVFGTITGGDILKGVAGAGMALGAAFAAAFAAAAVAIVGVVANISGQIAAFQQNKAKTLFAFDKLLGAGGGEKAWERIRAAADKTKSTLQETAQAFNNLVAAGFTLDQADTLFKQLADLKTLNPQANIDGIVRAIGQIRNIGKLQGDELNQLSEAGVNVDDVYTELSKRLGKTRDEVMKLKEAGKIKADDAIAAIQAAIAKRTGGDPGAVAGAAPKSAAESWERLKQKFFDMVSMDFGPLTRFLDKLESALDGDAGKALAAAFEDLAKAAGEFLDGFTKEDLEGLLRTAAGLVQDIASGMRTAGAAAKEINDALREWDKLTGQKEGSSLGGVVKGAGRGTLDMLTGGGFSAIGAAWDLWVAQWDLIGSLASKFAEAVSLVAAQAGTWFDSAVSLGTSLVDGIIAGLRQKWDALLADVSSLGASARNAFGAAIGEGSPAREFYPAGRSIPEGVAVGVEQGQPTLGGAMDQMAVAAMGRAGAGLGASIRAGGSSSTATTNINMQNPDPSQWDQRMRQIVRQEQRRLQPT